MCVCVLVHWLAPELLSARHLDNVEAIDDG